MSTKTLWDEYALAAMQRVNCDTAEEAAMHSASYADAMMYERAKRFTDAKPEPHGDDGWIEWNGGECPVTGLASVAVRLRDGYESRLEFASSFVWAHGSDDIDPESEIIAYRIVSHEK